MRYTFGPHKKSDVLHGHLHMGGTNPAGERIDVTSLYLTRGGRPWIPVMGEFHFSRCCSSEWETELCKIKAGGVNIISTYLFWIHHEEREGLYDFSDRYDVRRFVCCCRDLGLHVILRLGPWVHGECRNGGLPDWLLHKGIPLRQDHPDYLALVRRWYQAIYDQIQGLLYKDGGPIIGIQLENELVDDAQHLATLKRIALETGYDVPLYTVTGWNSVSGARIPVDEVLPVFAAYADAPWTSGTEPLPLSPHYVFDPTRNDAAVGADLIEQVAGDGWQLPYARYPYATCEIGPGQQSTYHRRVHISAMDAYAMSLVKLGCGNNLIGYYMYHGGTNPIGKDSTFNESRASGYPNDYPILNYDFDTALTQYGEVQPQYRWLNLLHLFVADFGAVLAAMEYVQPALCPVPQDLQTLRYCMRTNGHAGFVFVNHHQRHAALKPVSRVELDTGIVTFPPVEIAGEIAFFFPFGLHMGARKLAWATAQPVCRSKNTFFFAAIPGIPAQYQIDDHPLLTSTGESVCLNRIGDIQIVTLPMQDALFLRKLDGRILLGDNCDLYTAGGKVLSVQPGDFSYSIWQGDHFSPRNVHRPFWPAETTLTPCEEPFKPPFEEELLLGNNSIRNWYKISVTTNEGFFSFSKVYDVAQIYADGELVADSFFCGNAWRVPAYLLYKKQCYLVTSSTIPME